MTSFERDAKPTAASIGKPKLPQRKVKQTFRRYRYALLDLKGHVDVIGTIRVRSSAFGFSPPVKIEREVLASVT